MARRRTIRTKHRRRAEVSAAARVEAKVLEACAAGWAPFPGSGVSLSSLRRLEAAGKVEFHSEIVETPEGRRIVCRFRAITCS